MKLWIALAAIGLLAAIAAALFLSLSPGRRADSAGIASVESEERPEWLLFLPEAGRADDSLRIWWSTDSLMADDSVLQGEAVPVDSVRVFLDRGRALIAVHEARRWSLALDQDRGLATPIRYVAGPDDDLYREVLSAQLDSDGIVAGERRDAKQAKLAEPKCEGGAPMIVYSEPRLRRLSPYALGFLRYHELAHFVLQHKVCPSGGRYDTSSERAADSVAVLRLVPSAMLSGYVGAYAQYLFREDGGGDDYYEPDRARARYLIRFLKAARRGR